MTSWHGNWIIGFEITHTSGHVENITKEFHYSKVPYDFYLNSLKSVLLGNGFASKLFQTYLCLFYDSQLWNLSGSSLNDMCTTWNTRPTLERQTTLGCLRSIKPNMINHFAKQSQTCQLLKNIFLTLQKQKPLKSGVISNWIDIDNIYRIPRG